MIINIFISSMANPYDRWSCFGTWTGVFIGIIGIVFTILIGKKELADFFDKLYNEKHKSPDKMIAINSNVHLYDYIKMLWGRVYTLWYKINLKRNIIKLKQNEKVYITVSGIMYQSSSNQFPTVRNWLDDSQKPHQLFRYSGDTEATILNVDNENITVTLKVMVLQNGQNFPVSSIFSLRDFKAGQIIL